MLIFGDSLINMKTENRRKKFVHNLKALKEFLQSPKANKKNSHSKAYIVPGVNGLIRNRVEMVPAMGIQN